jgi:putative MFS transporter
VVTVLLIDKVGRRVLCVPPQWLCTVLLAILGFWAGAPGWVVLTLFLAFSFFNAGYNTLKGIYPGEVFPTEIRGIGTGFATAVSRVGAGAGTFLLPISMTDLGPGPTMLFAAGLAFTGAALSQWLAPRRRVRASRRPLQASRTSAQRSTGGGVAAGQSVLRPRRMCAFP